MKAENARAGDAEAEPGAHGPEGGAPAPGLATASAPSAPAPRMLDQLLAAISDGIVATDAAGMIVFANQAAASAAELATPAELIGRSLADTVARFEFSDEDGHALAFADLPGAQALRGVASERLVCYRRVATLDDTHEDGRWALIKATPALGARGEVQYAVQVIRDVSDRERERQLHRGDYARLAVEARQALLSRNDLLAIVSHDLRNPLGVVLTSSALLLRAALPTDKGDRARRQVEAIQRAGNRMNRLIRDLLDFASIEAGDLPLTRRPHDVATLLVDVVDVLRPVAAAKSQDLAGEPVVNTLTVDADHERLVQVFSSVIGNSCKFGREGGHVRIEAALDGAAIRFTVADDGPGMSPEELENLFNRAWQAARTSRDGIGLGLSIVKGIVEAHGGRVWAESTPGEGTRVSFTIPAAASA
jgi:signal transduction histidine kinase